ncbi:MAG: hypothetical protein Q9160_002178 [Pyrenula sp. 1 TL-2023]
MGYVIALLSALYLASQIDPIAQQHTDEAQSLAHSLGSQLTYHQLDVTDSAAVQNVFSTANAAARHPPRGLICCAGLSDFCPALDYNIDRFRKIIDLNVSGTFLACQAAAKIFHDRNVAASIVIFASMSGYVVNQGVPTSAYNASKSALHQLSRSLASEWGSNPTLSLPATLNKPRAPNPNPNPHPPIRVNTLSPGYIRTAATTPSLAKHPGLEDLWEGSNMLGRLAEAHEMRAPVLALLGDGGAFVTGADFRVDGGHCAW